MNIDWSKAPEGCIGAFVRGRHVIYVETKLVSSYENRPGFEGICVDGHEYHVFTEYWTWHEHPASWNGEGLPPVGVIVKLRTRLSPKDEFEGWGKAEIMYSSENAVVWRWQGHSREFGSEWDEVEFEAIRTPEQIAAEEREKAIEEMWKVYWQPDVPTAKQALGLLYDAGYRKQEQTK